MPVVAIRIFDIPVKTMLRPFRIPLCLLFCPFINLSTVAVISVTPVEISVAAVKVFVTLVGIVFTVSLAFPLKDK